MLSVVVPVFNEEENLRPLIDEIVAALDGRLEFEMVFVDDCSSDASLELLHAIAAEEGRLRVVRHLQRGGQSAGVRSGARTARFAWIATLDGDGQNDPADLPKLWQARPAEHSDEQPWMAIGHRVERRDSGAKRFASRFANGLRSRLLRDRTPDTGCGIKLIPRHVLLELPWFSHAHRFLPALVRRAGGEAVSVPVNHRPRTRGKSKYGVLDRAWVGLWDLFGVMWLMRRHSAPPFEISK